MGYLTIGLCGLKMAKIWAPFFVVKKAITGRLDEAK